MNPMFRFTIRDLLWLTVGVALSIGWITAERRAARHKAAYELDEKLLENAIIYGHKLQRDADGLRQAKPSTTPFDQ
jgi:hypothetical protein